jgi:hypothetical protein
MDYAGIVIPVIAVIVGLLMGYAIRRGALTFGILLVVGLIIWYVSYYFIPSVSPTTMYATVSGYLATHVSIMESYVTSIIPIGSIGALSLVGILFLVALSIGLWKGKSTKRVS